MITIKNECIYLLIFCFMSYLRAFTCDTDFALRFHVEFFHVLSLISSLLFVFFTHLMITHISNANLIQCASRAEKFLLQMSAILWLKWSIRERETLRNENTETWHRQIWTHLDLINICLSKLGSLCATSINKRSCKHKARLRLRYR